MNMKKYAMILVAISMSFVSCEKWLDLQQEGEITASQLYGKGEGYRTALNGLYQAMGRPDLYGRESSFGYGSHCSGNVSLNHLVCFCNGSVFEMV